MAKIAVSPMGNFYTFYNFSHDKVDIKIGSNSRICNQNRSNSNSKVKKRFAIIIR